MILKMIANKEVDEYQCNNIIIMTDANNIDNNR